MEPDPGRDQQPIAVGVAGEPDLRWHRRRQVATAAADHQARGVAVLDAEARGDGVGEVGGRGLGRHQRRRQIERDQHVERGRRRVRRPLAPRQLDIDGDRGHDVDRDRGGGAGRLEVRRRPQRDQRVAGHDPRDLDVGEDVEREIERELAAERQRAPDPRVRPQPQPDQRREPRRQLDVELGLADLGTGDDADVEHDLAAASVGQHRRADPEPELVLQRDRDDRLDDDPGIVVEQEEARLGDRREPDPRQVLIGQVQREADAELDVVGDRDRHRQRHRGAVDVVDVGVTAVELEADIAEAPPDQQRRIAPERDTRGLVVRGLGPGRGRGAGAAQPRRGAAETVLIERIGGGDAGGARHAQDHRASHSPSSTVTPIENTWPPESRPG